MPILDLFIPLTTMPDLTALMAFSHTHCTSICALLIPALLVASTQVMLFSALGRSQTQVRLMAAVSCLYALVLVLHILTWFVIGVILPATFLLLLLAIACSTLSLWIGLHPQPLHQWVQQWQWTWASR